MARAYWSLAVAVIATSTSAVFARLAHAPALTIAFSRCLIASLALAPFAIPQMRKELSAKSLKLTLISGGMLAVHFSAWIASLDYTSVSSSVVLVCSAPLFVAIAAPKITGDHLRRVSFFGLATALVGTIVIGAGDFHVSGRALIGDLLALTGAIAAAGYILLGRLARRELSLPTYAFITYGTAFALIFAAALLSSSTIVGMRGESYFWIIAIGLVPQLIGHSSYNWALGSLTAPVVSTALLLEPIGASVLAWLILREIPTMATLWGGVLILFGVLSVIWLEGTNRKLLRTGSTTQ